MNMRFLRQLPIPMEIKNQYPLTERDIAQKKARDAQIRDVFFGKSDRFILIIGPCSADREDSVIDYVSRLRRVASKVEDKLIIIPRLYTNKPRTSGDGYMGMLHQPNPDEKPDILSGIIAIRKLHIHALRTYGFDCADELLYPENYRYLSDLLAYVAIGARSVENQQHRLSASGFDIPVGMKNPTGGDLSIMLNSIGAAQSAHTFIYRGWEVETQGNPLSHAILRGYTDFSGKYVSNYHYESLSRLSELYLQRELANPAVIVDTSHANSAKQYLEQIRIAKDVLYSRNHSADIRSLVKGLMIESYIEDGAQAPSGRIYGKSITDACLGWKKTEELIYTIAETV